MTPDTLHTQLNLGRFTRRWVACVCAVGLLVLAGCKSDKDAKPGGVGGTGVARGKDPLVYGPTRIPQQNLPIPDRATGPKNGPKPDPLTMPTGGKAGYSDDPERFKGTFIPGQPSTPASLAGRIKDGEELKIADTGGVKLTGGTLPGGGLEAPAEVEPQFVQLEKFGVKREDRTLNREDGQWVFRASVAISGNGARRQYTGAAPTASEAVKQVVDQVVADRK